MSLFRPTRSALLLTLAATAAIGCDHGQTTPSDATEAPRSEPPGPVQGSFTLLYRDDFEALDAARWQLMTHSWAENLALFSAETATIEQGSLVLSVSPSPSGTVDDTGTPKPYLGAEVRSVDTLTYGRVRARIKFAAGSAVVSSLVSIYTPWPADDWNELDIECLGAPPRKVQLNTMVYTGPPTAAPVSQSVKPTQFPRAAELGFDPSADFHVYEMSWTPESVRFLVDDVEVHTWTDRIELMKLPQNVLLTIWVSASSGWAGPVGDETAGAKAYYDWVELYRYSAD